MSHIKSLVQSLKHHLHTHKSACDGSEEIVLGDSLADLAEGFRARAGGEYYRSTTRGGMFAVIAGEDLKRYFGRPGTGVYLAAIDGQEAEHEQHVTQTVTLRACINHDPDQKGPTRSTVVPEYTDNADSKHGKGSAAGLWDHECEYSDDLIAHNWRTIQITESGGHTFEEGRHNWHYMKPPFDKRSTQRKIKETFSKAQQAGAWGLSADGRGTFAPTASQAAEISFLSRPSTIKAMAAVMTEARIHLL